MSSLKSTLFLQIYPIFLVFFSFFPYLCISTEVVSIIVVLQKGVGIFAILKIFFHQLPNFLKLVDIYNKNQVMTTAEKRRRYFKKYYQQHKDKCQERNKRNYQRRKELGIQVGDQDLYNTVEELKQAEIEEFGAEGEAINWTKWEELIEQTKQDITNALKDYKTPKKRKPIYCYTMTTKMLIITFQDSDEAATALNLTRIQVTNHARTNVPIYYKGIILSYQEI